MTSVTSFGVYDDAAAAEILRVGKVVVVANVVVIDYGGAGRIHNLDAEAIQDAAARQVAIPRR